MTNQLLVGAGDWRWAGWTTLDANPESGADVIASVPPLPDAVKAVRWSRILASHFIEHLFLWDAAVFLRECYAVLEPGGVLTLEQPNLLYCAKVLAGVLDPPPGRDRDQFSMWGFYGQPNGNPLYGHHWGYTPVTLAALVTEAGFDPSNITISAGRYHEPERDFTLEATR